jgi:hypothetical protein
LTRFLGDRRVNPSNGGNLNPSARRCPGHRKENVMGEGSGGKIFISTEKFSIPVGCSLAGRTVGAIKSSRVARIIGVPENACCEVDGNPVLDSHMASPGQLLSFFVPQVTVSVMDGGRETRRATFRCGMTIGDIRKKLGIAPGMDARVDFAHAGDIYVTRPGDSVVFR